VMIAIAFMSGLWTASRRCLRDGISPEKVMDLGPWLIVGSIIGARIFYVVTFWREEFAGQPMEIFMIQKGGLVYYGGLIGACLAVLIYANVRKVPLWKLADVLTPSIALGYVFGRIGCLMNGCCYGKTCSMPWAIQFPPSHHTYPDHVHPTQIYDSLLSLALYCFLAWLYRRKKFDGQIFVAYLVAYAFTRSFVEFFRGDYPADQHYLGGWATPAQTVSILILAAGVSLFFLLPRRPVRVAS
jgi:phosphatidylglycerol:prolipoprotein diacylglycerol transferase